MARRVLRRAWAQQCAQAYPTFAGISLSSTVRSSTAVDAQPWFHVNMGTLQTPGLTWRTHLHSEIAGLAPDSESSPLVATSGPLGGDDPSGRRDGSAR